MKGPLRVTDDVSTDPQNPHEQTPLLGSDSSGDDDENTIVDREGEGVPNHLPQPEQSPWRIDDWWFNPPLFRSRWHLFEIADIS